MLFEIEGVALSPITTVAASFTGTGTVTSVTDGQLTVVLRDGGGADPNVVINSLVITPVAP